MSRQYAAVFTSIWRDPEFKALSSDAQRVYLLAVSQPDISWCGVVPFTSRRWSTFATDTTAKGITKAVDTLIGKRYVLLDEDTEELWVRGFIKHNVEKQPKLKIAAKREFAEVHSEVIRSALVRSYGWLADAEPMGTAKGFLPEPDSAVSGVGVKGSVSGQPPNPDSDTPTPTPLAFVEGCRLAAVEQCASWIERGSSITNEVGWIEARTKTLVRDRADVLEMAQPNDTVSAQEWRCLIQTGRFSEQTAASHPLGCDACSGGWVYPEDESSEVVPCANCASAGAGRSA